MVDASIAKELFDALSEIVFTYRDGEVHLKGCGKGDHSVPFSMMSVRVQQCEKIRSVWLKARERFVEKCPHCNQDIRHAESPE